MKYIASCSNGKDSLAMILLILEKKYPLDMVIFFDAGKEFESIYKNWDKLTKILDENFIPYARLTPDKPFDYYFCEHKVNTRDGSAKVGYSWCGGRCRWMTDKKVRAITNFIKQTFGNSEYAEYVGIAADELDRVKIERGKNKIYPLILNGLTENDCLVKCYKAGFNWLESNGVDLYDVLDRVSCYCCGNKNLNELKAIHNYLPQYWQKLEDMQLKTNLPFRENTLIFDLGERFKKEK